PTYIYTLSLHDALPILQLRALNVKESAGWLTDQEADRKACLTAASATDVFALAEHAESAKRIVRSEDFYDADKLEWALNTFRERSEEHTSELQSRGHLV